MFFTIDTIVNKTSEHLSFAFEESIELDALYVSI